MAGERGRSPLAVATWGTFLIFLGVVFMLQTTGVLPWTLWGTLWRFWPVALILMGVGILVRGWNVWLVSLVSVAILGGCLGIALWQHGPLASSHMETETVRLGDLERAEIQIDFAAGRLEVGSLSSGSIDLVDMAYEVRDGQRGLASAVETVGTGVVLRLTSAHYLSWPDAGTRWRVDLTRSIPLVVSVRSSASDVELDLRRLEVVELKLDLGAGNCRVTLPSSAGVTSVDIDVNVANLEITVPDGVAARIRVDSGLSLIDVDKGRFPRQGDYFQSPDYEGAANRVDMVVSCDVGRVEVE